MSVRHEGRQVPREPTAEEQAIRRQHMEAMTNISARELAVSQLQDNDPRKMMKLIALEKDRAFVESVVHQPVLEWVTVAVPLSKAEIAWRQAEEEAALMEAEAEAQAKATQLQLAQEALGKLGLTAEEWQALLARQAELGEDGHDQ